MSAEAKRPVVEEVEVKRSRLTDATSMEWTDTSRSGLCVYLSRTTVPRSTDLMRARDMLTRCANDLRTSKALVHEPFSLSETLWCWLLVHQERVPDLPAPQASASSSSASSVAAPSRIDLASAPADRSLPFDDAFLKAAEWKCAVSEHKGCDKLLAVLLARLSTFLRCAHQIGPKYDLYHFEAREWAVVEKDLSDFVAAHLDKRSFLAETAEQKRAREEAEQPRKMFLSNVPLRLARLSLQAFQECSALVSVFEGAKPVAAFSTLELKDTVLASRVASVTSGLKELAARFMAGDVDEVFGRRYQRFLARLAYPAGTTQLFSVANRENVAPRPDESVSVLQRGLVRLGVDEEKMYVYISYLKKLSSIDSIRSAVKEGDPVATFFVFAHHFAEETKCSFVENFTCLSEHVLSSVRQSHLRSSTREGRFRAVPTVALFAGRCALWHRGEYIDFKKDPLGAAAAWIVYVRDVFRGDLEQFTSNSVYLQFLLKRFPLA